MKPGRVPESVRGRVVRHVSCTQVLSVRQRQLPHTCCPNGGRHHQTLPPTLPPQLPNGGRYRQSLLPPQLLVHCFAPDRQHHSGHKRPDGPTNHHTRVRTASPTSCPHGGTGNTAAQCFWVSRDAHVNVVAATNQKLPAKHALPTHLLPWPWPLMFAS